MSEHFPIPVVVCAAIRSKEGKIVAGARHWDSVMRGQVCPDGRRPTEWLSTEQGFIDQFGNFLTREQAWTVAVNAKQLVGKHVGRQGVLYSEDLY